MYIYMSEQPAGLGWFQVRHSYTLGGVDLSNPWFRTLSCLREDLHCPTSTIGVVVAEAVAEVGGSGSGSGRGRGRGSGSGSGRQWQWQWQRQRPWQWQWQWQWQ